MYSVLVLQVKEGKEEWEIGKLETGNMEMEMCTCLSLCAGQLSA